MFRFLKMHIYNIMYIILWIFQVVLAVKNLAVDAGDRRHGFSPWVTKIPWRRAWPPTPIFLPRESPWTEEPGRLQSMGSQRVRHD